MKKKLIKFLIIVNILLTTFSTNILAQNRISGEKLEKLLIENHIVIYDHYGPLRNEIELNFNANKTYKLNGIFPLTAKRFHPSSGTWELVGFGNSSVRLNDVQNNGYNNNNIRFQLLFGDDGNIYDLNEKLYSYRLENKKERVENNARRIEEERKAEELRLKKIEEEKRQLAIKREQERVKAEQIKRDEEKKRLDLEEYLKKQEEERIKKQNEEKIKADKEKLYNIILFLIGVTILAIAAYYVNKFHKAKIKSLYLNLQNFFKNIFPNFKNIFPNKEFLDRNIKNISALQGSINKPLKTLNLKDFNIGKSTLFEMLGHNSFQIKFKKKIFKEDFLNFLKKNSIFNEFSTSDSKEFYINLKKSFRYEWEQNYKYAEKITNLINQKFSSLVNLTNDEIFHYKEWLSDELKNNGKVTFSNRIIMWIGIPFITLILWSNIYGFATRNDLCKCPCYYQLDLPHTYYDPKTGNYIRTPQFHNFLKDHCK